MNIYLYIIIFTMGTLFGSFYTLAVYRIPKNLDITRTHSFCPNCNHKLGFFELIPVWSYIFLGAKCKECKQKIRPRYFILEILSGLTFVLIAYGLKIDAYNLEINKLIEFSHLVLYLVSIFIIAGIDKEYREIEKKVLYYSILVSCTYIIYLCIMDETSIYRYVMYLITLIILLSIDSVEQLKQAKESYILECLMLIVTMIANTGELVTLASCLIVFLAIAILKIALYIKNALNKSKKENVNINKAYHFGYLFCISNLIFLILSFYIK